jgi:bla regulator protein BlaR1
VWIAWRRLSLEAERSCDDAVLRSSEPTAYADQLVRLARRLSAAKSPVLAMANRAHLAARVGAVLDGRQRRGRAGAFAVALASGAAAMLIIAISPLTLVAATQAAPAAAAKFDVASVRPNTKRGNGPPDIVELNLLRAVANSPQHGQFRVEGIPLNLLIQLAYNVTDSQLQGAPSWANSDRYDVTAKAEGSATFEQMRPMLQSLLAERFKLTLRREIRKLPVYDLAGAKGGIKIVAAKEGSCVMLDPNRHLPPFNPNQHPLPFNPNRPPPPLDICGGVRRIVSLTPDRRDRIEAVGISMPKLIEMLSHEVGRNVRDKTGFTATFDLYLEFASDKAIVGGFGPAPPGGPGRFEPTASSPSPSIFTAVQEQLGLRLESADGPVEVLAIGSVERPSEKLNSQLTDPF